MFKNIFLMFTLFLFTIVGILIVNFLISIGIYAFTDFDIYTYSFFYIVPILLLFYLIYILIHAIKNNELSINYGYSYLGFLGLLLIYYFGYFTYIDEHKYIPEIEFETKLQNIEVKDEENGLIILGNYLEKNEGFISDISNLINNRTNVYNCLIGKKDVTCDKEVIDKKLKEYLLFIDDNKIEIENMLSQMELIGNYKYFKHDTSINEYVSLQGLSTLSKFSLFVSIYSFEYELDNRDPVDNIRMNLIDLNTTYLRLGERLLKGDSSFIGMIVGTSISDISLKNLKYLSENYKLSSFYQKYLLNKLNIDFDYNSIYGNAIKMEYQINKISNDKNLNSSMFLNKNEFFSLQRYGWDSLIKEGKDIYDNYEINYFKRQSLYYFLGGMSFSNFSGYDKNIEELNIKILNIKNIFN